MDLNTTIRGLKYLRLCFGYLKAFEFQAQMQIDLPKIEGPALGIPDFRGILTSEELSDIWVADISLRARSLGIGWVSDVLELKVEPPLALQSPLSLCSYEDLGSIFREASC